MAKEIKNIIVNEYTSRYKNNKNFVLFSFKGISAAKSDELRETLRKSGVMFTVVKNSLIVIVFKELGVESLSEFVNGPCAIATNEGESIELVKVLTGCVEKIPSLKINAGHFDGRLTSVSEIEELSKIPDKSVLHAQILAGIQAPMVGIVSAVNSVMRGIAICLKEIRDKKQ